MAICNDCPRKCNIERNDKSYGFCSVPKEAIIAKTSIHKWEEPCLSGTRGSGTIFFSGCNLRCVFCQNSKISQCDKKSYIGEKSGVDGIINAMLSLQDKGVHNINLVTPSHFVSDIRMALTKAKSKLHIPVIYNSGGYDSVESLKSLEGLIDIYMPDFKYFSEELSKKYSNAKDYFKVACDAVTEMHNQVGSPVFLQENGVQIMKRGLIIRHLILPGCRKDSIKVLDELSKLLKSSDFLISIMRQYTDDFVDKEKYPELARKITTFEYNSVLSHAQSLGFNGFSQSKESASAKYTPDFNC